MRTLRSSPIVSTSPAFTACPGAFSRTPLMRTWPASTSAAALVRAFTTRACHNHLSRRWRSKQHHWKTDRYFGLSSDASSRHEPAPTLDHVRGRLSPENALAVLAVGSELFFQRGQLGKRRIGV